MRNFLLIFTKKTGCFLMAQSMLNFDSMDKPIELIKDLMGFYGDGDAKCEIIEYGLDTPDGESTGDKFWDAELRLWRRSLTVTDYACLDAEFFDRNADFSAYSYSEFERIDDELYSAVRKFIPPKVKIRTNQRRNLIRLELEGKFLYFVNTGTLLDDVKIGTEGRELREISYPIA